VELTLVDQVAALTQVKRTDVLKNALNVYQWFVRQALMGSKVIARKPSGEEVTLETVELSALAGRGGLLTPEDLEALAQQLVGAKDEATAAPIRERLMRGFYGIQCRRSGVNSCRPRSCDICWSALGRESLVRASCKSWPNGSVLARKCPPANGSSGLKESPSMAGRAGQNSCAANAIPFG
jgi:hypothetical protein